MSNYFVIFGGGGIRGISYCGAVKALSENNINITGCAGSSVGAVFASLYAVGYNYEEIFKILSDFGMDMLNDINFDIKKEIAFSKGHKFYEWIKRNIEEKFYKEKYIKNSMIPVCFKDLEKNLIIYSVDLTKLKFKEFSKAKTPDYEVAKAIRASVSMPGLFVPLEDSENYLVDGDLLKSAPLWRLSDTIKNSKDRILEFRLEDNGVKKDIKNPLEYLDRVYNAISGFATDYIIDIYNSKDKFDYIKINTPDISVVNFLIPQNKRQELFDIGYKTTNEYFRKFIKEKRETNKLKYKKVLNKFMYLQKKFLKKDYCTTYLSLCEIFILLCEEKKYLDTNLYDRIVKFKDLFVKNYTQYSILGFKKTTIKNNKEELYKELIDIVKILTNKIDENY